MDDQYACTYFLVRLNAKTRLTTGHGVSFFASAT
jgi:hypothetical protein